MARASRDLMAVLKNIEEEGVETYFAGMPKVERERLIEKLRAEKELKPRVEEILGIKPPKEIGAARGEKGL